MEQSDVLEDMSFVANSFTGNVCDSDTDNDGIDDVVDNCPAIPNSNQTDADGNAVYNACPCSVLTMLLCEGDGRGDVCQGDFDGDGVSNNEDNCPVNPFISQTNFTSYLNISIDFDPSTAPEWIITDEV